MNLANLNRDTAEADLARAKEAAEAMRYRVRLIGHNGQTLATLSIPKEQLGGDVTVKLREGKGIFVVGEYETPPFQIIPASAVATATVEEDTTRPQPVQATCKPQAQVTYPDVLVHIGEREFDNWRKDDDPTEMIARVRRAIGFIRGPAEEVRFQNDADLERLSGGFYAVYRFIEKTVVVG